MLMNKPLIVLCSCLVVVITFGVGVLTGRQFPAHHFEKIPSTPYILDSSTGKLCKMFADTPDNPYAKYAVPPGSAVAPYSSDNIPVCSN